jgi:peptidoglycan hydrolase-like protein with peptidoglycan-binding domain
MRHRWFTMIVIAGIAMLITGPVLAQGTGSGSSSGSTTTPQASPSQQPSAGTPMPPASGKAQPGATQGSSGTESPTKSATGSKPGMTGGQSATGQATNGKSGSEQVKNVQKALQEKGADPGPIDGIMGPKTEAALKAFQKEQKLPETGRLDSQTLAKLGVSAQ